MVVSQDSDQWRAGGLIPVIAVFVVLVTPAGLAGWGMRFNSTAAVRGAAWACIPGVLFSVICLPALAAFALLARSPVQGDRHKSWHVTAVAVVTQIAAMAALIVGRPTFEFRSGQAMRSGTFIDAAHGAVAIGIAIAGTGLAILLVRRESGPIPDPPWPPRYIPPKRHSS